MNKICNSEFILRLKSCLRYRKENTIEKVAPLRSPTLPDSLQADYFVENLRKNKDDVDQFIRLILKPATSALNHLLILEDEVDLGNFLDVMGSMTRELIEKHVETQHEQAYFYYLMLKVEITTHNKNVSMDSLLGKKYDFSTDRLIAEFIQNLLYLKNVYKFIIFEDRDDKEFKMLISKRATFFEWLSTKLFKLLLFFSCNVDYCKDNKLLINFCQKIKEYYDLCERYLISAYSTSSESHQSEQYKSFVEVYTKDLLAYLKLFAYNREKQTPADESKTLELINLCLNRLVMQHPLIFIKLKQEFEEFSGRVKILRAKYVITPPPVESTGKRRAISDNDIVKLSGDLKDDSADDAELDDEINELYDNEQRNRLYTIKEMSSRYEKQSSAFDGGDEEFQKFDMRKRPIVRRSSFSKLKKSNANFI